MKSLVRPELSTASVGSSQAITAAVDNSAPLATRPKYTYKSGKVAQTNGATSINPVALNPKAIWRHPLLMRADRMSTSASFAQRGLKRCERNPRNQPCFA